MKNMILKVLSLFSPLLFLGTIIAFFILLAGCSGDEIPPQMIPYLAMTVGLLFLSVIGIWFFIVYDIVHIAKRQEFSSAKKVGWICAIWCLSIFTIPIYAFKYFK
jgi:hypothetical protein